MLTREDIALIVEQVKLQHDESPEHFAGFALAWAECLQECESILPRDMEAAWLLDRIKYWHELVKWEGPIGWRKCELEYPPDTPRARDVPSRMRRFAELFADQHFPDATAAYKAFEEIHPFEDGNGRVGMLLWRMYHFMQKNDWPDGQPPDLWK